MNKKVVFSLFMFLILACAGFFPFAINGRVQAEEKEYVRVIMNTTYVFKTATYPNKITDLADGEYKQVKLNDLLELNSSAKISDTNPLSQLKYYEVNVENFGIGYVLTTHVIPKEIKSLDNYVDNNAEINKNGTVAYSYENNAFTEISGITLDKGEKIKLLDGYDMSKEYLRAMIVVNDVQVIVYFKRVDVMVKGISLTVILAIGIITLFVAGGGVFGYFYFKKRKRKS